MHPLPQQRVTSAFSVRSLRPGRIATGHLLTVDHFLMSQPTFPPHPHAGFSAVTWMAPWSAGSFRNRDSHGDSSLIQPGSLHWTLAGAGMLHEEIPTHPGVVCEGLQMFVKLPEPEELAEPRAFHVEPDEIPRVQSGGSTIRVLAGAVRGVRSRIPDQAGTTLLHVETGGQLAIDVPSGVEAFALVLRGQGQIAGTAIETGAAIALAAGQSVRMGGEDLCALVAWSLPMAATPRFDGPFCMFRSERLVAARAAYRSGAMGRLEASDVDWSR
jgi:hypothetical protein